MDSHILSLVKKLKEGEISEDNLVDILSKDTPLQGSQWEQDPKRASFDLTTSHILPMTDSPTYNYSKETFQQKLSDVTQNGDKFQKYGIEPLVNITNILNMSNNTVPTEISEGNREGQLPNFDLSSVDPDEFVKFVLSQEGPSFKVPHIDINRMDNNPITMRPTVDSSRGRTSARFTIKKGRASSLPQDNFILNGETKREEYNHNERETVSYQPSWNNSDFFGRNSVVRDMTNIANVQDPDPITNVSEFFIKMDSNRGDRSTAKSVSPINRNSSSNMSFLKRNMCWVQKKNMKQQRIMVEKAERETKECSFKPNINPNSKKLAPSAPIDSRLFQSNVSEKLELLKEKIKQKEQEEFQSNCTFKPTITPYPAYLQNSKKENISQLSAFQNSTNVSQTESIQAQSLICHKVENLVSDIEKECVFVPQTNELSEAMTKANQYLQKNVVDRLYNRDFLIFGENRRQRILLENADNFTENIKKENEKLKKDQRLLSEIDTIFGDFTHATFCPTDMDFENEKRKIAQMSFLERQDYYIRKKYFDLVKLEEEIRPTFQPQISATSKLLAENREGGSFYERNLKYMEQAEYNRRLQELSKDLEYKFIPEITPLAQYVPPRSVDELCYGDAKKKLMDVAKLKLEEEKKFYEQCTFKPELSKSTSKHKIASRLGVDLPTKEYIQDYNKKLAEKENLKLYREQAKLKQELAECSFKPITTKLPEYYTNIRLF
jgi:hypothetical protein